MPAHAVTAEEPDCTGGAIVQRADDRCVAAQNDRRPKRAGPSRRRSGRRQAHLHFPVARCVAIVDVDGARSRVRAEGADHQPAARCRHRLAERRVQGISRRQGRFSGPRLAAAAVDVHGATSPIGTGRDIRAVTRQQNRRAESVARLAVLRREASGFLPAAGVAREDVDRADFRIGFLRAHEQRVPPRVERNGRTEAVAVRRAGAGQFLGGGPGTLRVLRVDVDHAGPVGIAGLADHHFAAPATHGDSAAERALRGQCRGTDSDGNGNQQQVSTRHECTLHGRWIDGVALLRAIRRRAEKIGSWRAAAVACPQEPDPRPSSASAATR